MSRRTKEKGLTAKQERFVQEYLIDTNATQAAIRAGYAKATAGAGGSQLLKNIRVRAAIEERLREHEGEAGITRERVLQETALLAFSDVTHYVMDDNGHIQAAEGAPEGAMRAISSIKRKVTTTGSGENARVSREVEFRLWDKPSPLKLAGRHTGLFPNTVSVKADDSLAKLLMLAAKRKKG